MDHGIILRTKFNPSGFVSRRWHGYHSTCRTEHLLLRLRMPFLADNNLIVVYLRDRYLVRNCLQSTACHSQPYSLNTTSNTIYMPMTLNFTLTSLETSLVTQILLLAESKPVPPTKRWMTSHQLFLNETKTETIVFYARNARVPDLQLQQSTCVGVI